MNIKIDYSRDSLFDENGLKRLHESYMRKNEASPQERLAFVAEKFSSNPDHAQRLYDYASKHWLSFSTPILSFGKTSKGLPISCYLNYVSDTAEGLVSTLAETNWLSMMGGGVGVGFGIRSASEISTGVMPHLKMYDASSLAYRQGKTRRGSYAVYLDISHPDIMMFIDMRKPTGDQNIRTPNLHHGVNITDDFMQIIEAKMKDPSVDDRWELKDPNNGTVKEVVSAISLWEKLIETRIITGEPYLHFIDTANKALPQWLKDRGLSIKQSNLCVAGDTEIIVYNKDRKSEFYKQPYMVVRIDDFINEMFGHGKWKIWSYDIESEIDGWSDISAAAMTNPNAELLEISFEGKYKPLLCTPDHNIFTKNRGYVMAKDLLETDILIIDSEVGPKESFPLKTRKVEEKQPVYDLTVDKTHNFFANGLLVHNCIEIELPTDADRTAVCCLSSVNLVYYDEWSLDPLFLQDVLEMLDNVLQYFIDHAPDSISRAKYSAMRERSVGVGALGFHAYLQDHGVPFESALAKSANIRIFKHIRTKLDKANLLLGQQRGEAPDAVGTGFRLSLVMAVAPNASSSIILGNTSPSIEPWRANAYRQDTLSGSFLNKNSSLNRLIIKKCDENSKLDYDEIWSSIVANDGSVQHLKFLDDYEKDIYKTAMEIDQRWIVEHAADRQVFIDQGQSVNLFFRPDANIKYLHAVHFLAWKKGVKGLYYCRSEKIGKTDKLSKRIERNIIKEINIETLADNDECLACQ